MNVYCCPSSVERPSRRVAKVSVPSDQKSPTRNLDRSLECHISCSIIHGATAVLDKLESLLKGPRSDASTQLKLAHNHRHRSLHMTLTLLQSMRLNKSFADFTVLGSQYENDDG